MFFTRHVTYQQIDLAPDRSKRNVYNTPVNGVTPKQYNGVTPKQYEVILFSSRLTHIVEPNTSNRPRHTIALPDSR